jgi:oligoendopeptidase F
MSGAFSSGAPGTYPFIVMSFDGTALSLGTLAHELGHSMHSYLAWETQPQVSSRYSLFVAEVASNFHQALLRAHLLDVIDERELQLAVLDEAMSNFHRYFFVMPTLARFEREMHERVERGDGLTADLLDERMADLFAEAYGAGFEVDRERVGITWAQFSHLYAPFYVYQYATGISGAHALARGVLDGDPGAAERYVDFLRAGGSAYPLDILRHAGVDLTSPAPVEEAFAVLASLVDRLESLAP